MSSEKLKTKEELSPIVVCQNCDGQNIGTNTHTYEGFCEDCKSVNVEIKMLSEVDDEQREAININYIVSCRNIWLPMDKRRKEKK